MKFLREYDKDKVFAKDKTCFSNIHFYASLLILPLIPLIFAETNISVHLRYLRETIYKKQALLIMVQM